MEVVEGDIEAGRMEGVELLFMNDNSVAEAMNYQGNSREKDIFALIIRLVYLELRGSFILNTIWVHGTRQKALGIDVFFKNYLTDGIGSSGSILEFVLLNETEF